MIVPSASESGNWRAGSGRSLATGRTTAKLPNHGLQWLQFLRLHHCTQVHFECPRTVT